jgi:hypothetical protein
MSADETNDDRRPPSEDEAAGASDGWADGAIISPDDPIVRKGPVELPKDFERVMHRREDDDGDDEVVVTGIGTDRRPAGPHGVPMDPYLERVVRDLAVLAVGLRRRGEAALHVEPDMTRFETTLRGYCVGYLAALRDSGALNDHD